MVNYPKSPLRTRVQRPRLAAVAWPAFAAALVLLLGVHSPAARASSAVGSVSLLVGQAHAITSDGNARKLERGATLHVGDRIETPVSGHVHVQFVDGGRLSVRPMSRLTIEDYAAPQADRPGSGAIRFRLESGVVRSITGQWGEVAKDRFRLNTPLAAIGVKGTDFAVRVEPDKTAAAVYTGAIVMAPMDSGCAATFGPCLNGSERLLTEAMKGQMMELSRSQTTPELVPAVGLLAQSTRAVPLGVVAAASGTRPVARLLLGGLDDTVSEALAADTARKASNVPAPVVTQFQWGRNANSLAGDTLSRPSGALLAEGARPSVGIFSYTLFTTAAPLAPDAVLGAGESAVSLRLANGYAGLVDIYGQSIETVAITGGRLNLDFARLLFSTTLNLSGTRLGQESLVADGTVSRTGQFYSANGNQLVAGAVTPDGKQAGYLFEKRVTPGVLRGITLWGR
jgi:hypothetical protein